MGVGVIAHHHMLAHRPRGCGIGRDPRHRGRFVGRIEPEGVNVPGVPAVAPVAATDPGVLQSPAPANVPLMLTAPSAATSIDVSRYAGPWKKSAASSKLGTSLRHRGFPKRNRKELAACGGIPPRFHGALNRWEPLHELLEAIAKCGNVHAIACQIECPRIDGRHDHG